MAQKKRPPDNTGGLFLISVLQAGLLIFSKRIEDFTDGHFLIDRSDKVCNIFGNIYLIEPLTLPKRIGAVGEIGTEHTRDNAITIGLIECIHPIRKDRIGRIGENTAGLAFFQLIMRCRASTHPKR